MDIMSFILRIYQVIPWNFYYYLLVHLPNSFRSKMLQFTTTLKSCFIFSTALWDGVFFTWLFIFSINNARNKEHTLLNSSTTNKFQLFQKEKSLIVMYEWTKLLMIDTTYLPPFRFVPSDNATVSVALMLYR